MTDADALLAAIRRDPDDDTVRLAYADEIEVEEPERAEFIRVQCELARIGKKSHYHWLGKDKCKRCRADQLRRRERELLADCGVCDVNMGETYLLVAPSQSVPCAVSRGFVEAVECPADVWLAHGPAVVRAHPVRTVRLTDKRPDEGDWDNVPCWVRDSDTDAYHPHRLPAVLYDRLEDSGIGWVDRLAGEWRWFHDQERNADGDAAVAQGRGKAISLAWEALSLACLAWAMAPQDSPQRIPAGVQNAHES